MNGTLDSIKAAAALMEALSSTFADMAFVDIEPARAGSPAPSAAEGQAPIRAAIDVLKPLSCRIEIECSASFRQRIEETLFEGQDAGPSEEDSLLEILNVAAGVFLTAYFGPGADIKLELPQYLYFSDGSEGEVLAEALCDAEGEPISAVLRSVRYRY